MRLRGWKSVRQASRWLRSRSRERAVILGYHRVADDPSDPFSLCVTPDHFAQHLDAIRRYGRPVPLLELVRALANGEPLDSAVAVTFDDGYADLATAAAPLLERHQVPATVFVIAGLLGREFWWDALWRILSTPGTLPERLSLTIDGEVLEWASPRLGSPGEARRELLFALHRRLLPLAEQARRGALDRLSEWTEAPHGERAGCRALAPEELVRLANGDLLEIGAHTVTHPVLPQLPVETQRGEIALSKARLEELVARPVISFSYPHGQATELTADLVREAGFECACTSRNDVVLEGTPSHDLPRFWVPNWDGATFSRWLARWLARRPR